METKRFQILEKETIAPEIVSMQVYVEKETIAPEIVSMQVYAPRLAESAQPGQFLIVIPDEQGERIPLTVCDYDRGRGTIRIVFQMLGSSTKKLGRFNVGESFLDVVGPLGRPSDFISESLAEVKNRSILFVAGGESMNEYGSDGTR